MKCPHLSFGKGNRYQCNAALTGIVYLNIKKGRLKICVRKSVTSFVSRQSRPYLGPMCRRPRISYHVQKNVQNLLSPLIVSARQRSWFLSHMVPLLAKYWKQKGFNFNVWSLAAADTYLGKSFPDKVLRQGWIIIDNATTLLQHRPEIHQK